MEDLKNSKVLDATTKQEIIDLYTEKSPKVLTRGKIKQSTLNKILEDINANCKKKD